MKTYLIIENEKVVNVIIADDKFVSTYSGTIIEFPADKSPKIGDSYINGEFVINKPDIPSEVLTINFQAVLFDMSIVDINSKLTDDEKIIMNECTSSETISRSCEFINILKRVYNIDNNIMDKIFLMAGKK